MSIVIKNTSGFEIAEEVLQYLSIAINNKLNKSTPSIDPMSDYAKLDKASRDVLDARLSLAAARLKEINNTIANCGLVDDINDAASEAKKEADRIKRAAKVVDDMVAFVDKIVDAVGFVGKLIAL